MYGMQGTRQQQPRMPDLLEQLKKEYEGMVQESNVMKNQRDDLQGKCAWHGSCFLTNTLPRLLPACSLTQPLLKHCCGVPRICFAFGCASVLAQVVV